MNHNLDSKLDEIKNFISQQQIAQKNILTLAEASTFTGLSKSYLYKKTSCRQIPFYKLEGKLIYFKKDELEEWLLTTRIASNKEILTNQNLKNGKI
jgi:excisionase family DNA binding protein